MPRTKKAIVYRTAAKQLALLAGLLCALLGGLMVVEAKRPLNATDLKIEASQLRSLSAEANELAGDALSGEVTQDYFDVHTQMLLDKSADTRKRLASRESQSGLEAYRRDVTDLADRLSVTTDPGDLTRIGEAAEKLERSLKTLQ